MRDRFWLHLTDTALSLVGDGTLTGLDVLILIPTVQDYYTLHV